MISTRSLISFLLAAFLLALPGRPTADNQEKPTVSERIVIEGVDRYRVVEPLFESVRVALNQHGETYSPGYIQGIAGSAFRIAGICPCAPTVGLPMDVVDLVALLGYEYESVPLGGEGVDSGKRLSEVLPRVKHQVRSGRPVIFWSAFTMCEFDVVCGFDEETGKLLGRGSYRGTGDDYAETDETQVLKVEKVCGLGAVIFLGDKTGELDARRAEVAGLREAVRIGRSRKNADRLDGDKWVMLEGLMCYDRWTEDWRQPDKKRGNGDSYCLGVFRSSRRAGVDFLREIALGYPEAADHLSRAADQFEAEADALDRCDPVFGWKTPEGPDPDRNEKAAALLTEARDHYAKGIAEIEAALVAIGESD
jgi:hypothetical protein